MKRFPSLVFGWLLAAFTLAASAADIQAGKHYAPVEPMLPVAAPGKIEVVEFFSYACPHCRDFNPVVTDWKKRLPADVTFRRVPITFNRPAWARLARIYYALESTGELAKHDEAVFRALHDERVNFNTDQSVFDWAAAKGIDMKKFGNAYNAFSMANLVAQGDKDAAAYRISGVPAMAVDGRWLVLNTGAESYGDLIRITDALIAKARAEPRKK